MQKSISLTDRVTNKLASRLGLHKSVARNVVVHLWPILVEEMLDKGKMVIPGLVTLSLGVSPARWKVNPFVRNAPKVWEPERPYLHCKWLPKFKDAAFAISDKPEEAPFTTWKSTFAKWYDSAMKRLAKRQARKEAYEERIRQWKKGREEAEAARLEFAVNAALAAHGVDRAEGYAVEIPPVPTTPPPQTSSNDPVATTEA